MSVLCWEDEPYVRLYTRDTTDWVCRSWQARTVFLHLLRKVDRSGTLAVGRQAARGLSALLHLPVDIIEPALTELEADGTIQITGGSLLIPNFLAAQTAKRSDAMRKREERSRRKPSDGDEPTDRLVTNRDGMSRSVTSGHAVSDEVEPRDIPSRNVTLISGHCSADLGSAGLGSADTPAPAKSVPTDSMSREAATILDALRKAPWLDGIATVGTAELFAVRVINGQMPIAAVLVAIADLSESAAAERLEEQRTGKAARVVTESALRAFVNRAHTDWRNGKLRELPEPLPPPKPVAFVQSDEERERKRKLAAEAMASLRTDL